MLSLNAYFRSRIFLALIVAVVLACVLGGREILHMSREAAARVAERDLAAQVDRAKTIARVLADTGADHVAVYDFDRLERLVADLAALDGVHGVEVFDADGGRLAIAGAAAASASLVAMPAQDRVTAERIEVTQAMDLGGGRQGAARVTLLRDALPANGDATLLQVARPGWLFGVVLTLALVAALVAWLLSRRLAAPVRDLSRLAAAVEQDAPVAGIQLAPFREFVGLREAFARMQDALARQRRATLHLATHDVLTGLTNRRGFYERVESRLASDGSIPFAVAYLDFDEFARLNDECGHAAGDQFLAHAARTMERVAAGWRAEDPSREVLVARIGGDEFALLVEGPDPVASALRLGDRLLDALAAAPELVAFGLPVRASGGVAAWPRDAGTVDGLVGSADHAMYASKHEGLGRMRAFEAPMVAQRQRRRMIERALRAATSLREVRLRCRELLALEGGARIGLLAEPALGEPGLESLAAAEIEDCADRGGIRNDLVLQLLDRIAARQSQGDATPLRTALHLSPGQLARTSFVDGLFQRLLVGGLRGRVALAVPADPGLADQPEAVANLARFRAFAIPIWMLAGGRQAPAPALLAALRPDSVVARGDGLAEAG